VQFRHMLVNLKFIIAVKTSICYWQDQPGYYRVIEVVRRRDGLLSSFLPLSLNNKSDPIHML